MKIEMRKGAKTLALSELNRTGDCFWRDGELYMLISNSANNAVHLLTGASCHFSEYTCVVPEPNAIIKFNDKPQP